MSKNPVYCKDGTIIDSAVISKYEGYFRSAIPKFLPACRLVEASMGYEDLLNQLRLEAVMALKNGYDPDKVFTSTLKDPKKREAALQKKLKDPAAAIERAKFQSVILRVNNYLRRVRWEYHPDQRGGRSVSFEAVVASTEMDESGAEAKGLFLAQDMVEFDRVQVEEDRAALLVAMEKGDEAVRELYGTMSKERQEDLVAYLSQDSSRRTECSQPINWDDLCFKAESESTVSGQINEVESATASIEADE